MSPEFHWRTGTQEADWDNEGTAAADPSAGGGRRRYSWLLRSAVVLVMISLVLGLARLQVLRAEAAVSEQVLNSHALILLADSQRDTELLRLSISGRDRAWGRDTGRLVAAGLFVNRPSFGLRALPRKSSLAVDKTPAADNPQVILAPDLAGAEVSWPVTYRAGNETIVLRQTAVYRRGSERWLLSPPDLDFWGGSGVDSKRHLTLTFPNRDQEVAKRLAIDLEQLLVDVCQTLIDLSCPEDLHVRLRLETKPGDYLAADGLKYSIHRGLQLRLPAPTLIGLPQDEAAYQALLRGYGSHLATAVLTEQLAYDCCRHGLFFQALMERQLVQLGLREWPLHQLDYERTAHDQSSLHDVGLFWRDEYLADQVDEASRVYALVDFLVGENRGTVISMLRVLAQSENLDYWDWLHLATGNRYADNQALESAWLSFLERRTSFTMVPPFPAPELQLTCQPTAGANAALYRYEPVEGHLEKEIDLMQESVLMVPVPTRNGVVVGEQRASGSSTATRLLLWQSGTQTVLSHSTYDLLPVSFDAALAGNQLLVLNRRTRQYGLLSLENCQTAGNCSVDTFPGLPLWSPDGQKAISLVATGNFGYEDRFARPFLMGDITGDILATGKAPFWMDDKTVAFIEPLDQSIMGVTVDQDAARYEILSIAKLVSSVPDWEDSKQMRLEHAAVMVGEPNSLLIVSADAESIYFFRQALPTGEVTFEAEADIVLEPQILYHYGYSPDDHWLVISGSDLTEGTSSIHLYNLNSRETASYQFAAVYDFPLHWLLSWSTDGQWLSVPDNGHLRLISPEADYQKLIVLEDLMCSGAVWVDHESG